MNIFELIGWFGSFIYILAYFLLVYKIIESGKIYYLLNKVAAFLIVIISIIKSTFQPIVINTIWLYISYMAYHQKEINIPFLNKCFLHIGSILLLLTSLIYFFINEKTSFEILAWFSVFAFSNSYFLYSMKVINEKTFHFYNFIAALSLIPNMVLFQNYQVVVLELLWAFFALNAYIKSTKNNNYLTLCS